MKKRNALTFLLVLCLVASFLTACGMVDGPIGLGHRYGNPELSFADGKVTIKYICVDCDYCELEERTVSTQVEDAAAWDDAFRNLSLTNYSVSFWIDDGKEAEIKQCIVTEDRAYYSSEHENAADPNRGESYASEPENAASSNKEECYTLQKEDGTYITYLRSLEDGSISLAPETDNAYFENIRKESAIYLSLEGMFEKFTYDAEYGRYTCSDPIEVPLRDANGLPLGAKSMHILSVNIADGQILKLTASYEEVNEYLETTTVVVNFYNIGYSVVKVPQQFIEAVTGKGDTTESGIYTYELRDGKVTITGVNTSVGGELTIPAVLDGYPVVAIGENAFANCASLTDITIPDSVISIGDNAFLGCDGLVNVTYAGTQAQWEAITVGQTGNAPLLNATIQFRVACEHSYDDGVVTKEPTCGAMGIKTYTCSACGDAKIEYLAKHNSHSFNEGVVTEDPTCNEAGIKTYTCSVCGKNKTEYIPKLATHTYTNGTCTSCGADDPHYAVEEEEKEIGGIVGAFIQLFESIFKIFSFFG